MKHYYFKFMKGNNGIELWQKNKKFKLSEDNKIPNIDLSIYFGKWKSEQYPNEIGNPSSMNRKQIDNFFNLQNEKKSVYLWIFYNEYILCFEPTNLNVFNGLDEYIDDNGSYPKSIEAKLIKKLKKIEHPEFFSNINSNQGYNRRTITELKNSEKEYADSIINGKSISIDLNNYYKYLSPTEFETLVFLIFTNEDSMCSSFRGGTLKDYDLRVFMDKEFHGIEKGEHWLQVKLKEYHKANKELLTIHLGDTSLKNKILGIDWINDRIKERKDIKKWLNKCTFNYDLLESKI